MTTSDIRQQFEKVRTEVNDLLTEPAAFWDRLRWLTLFDILDELKEDLHRGHGKKWPPGFCAGYVKLRTGIKELFDLLFTSSSAPPVAYALTRLTVYHNAVAETITNAVS